MNVNLIAVIYRTIALLVLVLLILPRAYQQSKVPDDFKYYRWGLFVGILLYTIFGVLLPDIVRFCIAFKCFQPWMNDSLVIQLASFTDIIVASILFIFYYIF